MTGTLADLRAQSATQERAAVLAAAGRLLLEEGSQALTMRRLAQELGGSTSILYSRFGSKGGLVEALFLEGFARLRAGLELAGAAHAGPLERIGAMGAAYRDVALSDPAAYEVMFGTPVPGWRPQPGVRAKGRASLAVLSSAIADAMRAGLVRDGDAEADADSLWAASHGAVALELAGHWPDREVAALRYAAVTGAVFRALLPHSSDSPDAARSPGAT